MPTFRSGCVSPVAILTPKRSTRSITPFVIFPSDPLPGGKAGCQRLGAVGPCATPAPTSAPALCVTRGRSTVRRIAINAIATAWRCAPRLAAGAAASSRLSTTSLRLRACITGSASVSGGRYGLPPPSSVVISHSVSGRSTAGSYVRLVSPISRNNCQASAETLSGITRSRNVKHQPRSYIHQSAPGRIRTCDTGFRRAVLYPLSYEGGRPELTGAARREPKSAVSAVRR